MARTRETTADVIDAREAGGVRFLRAIPGGAAAVPEEKAVAVLLLVLLLSLVLLRKAFRGGLGAGHLHIGGLDAILVGIYLMMWTAVLRTFAGWLSDKVPEGTGGAVAYVVP